MSRLKYKLVDPSIFMIDDLVKGMNGNHWAEIFSSFIILSDNRYMILEQTRLIWKINIKIAFKSTFSFLSKGFLH